VRFYEATSEIEAPPEAIWAVLVDGAGYPTWDSGVERVEGRIAEGETITVRSKAAPGRAFPVTVSDVQANRSMRWSGGMPLGLFRGVRTFTLTPTGGETTRFDVREEYTGPLLGMMWRSMPDLGPSFRQFADGLKARVEAADATG
jgi:hypothetical protein